MTRQTLRWISAAALVALWPLSAAADDPVNGASLYQNSCSGCHGSTPHSADSLNIGRGRNARSVIDVAIDNVGSMSSLRTAFPAGGSSLADVAAYLGVMPDALSFPSTAVGSTSTTQSITVYPSTKAGNGISGMTVGISGDFSRNGGTCGTTLAAGSSSCTVFVRFAPTAAGSRTGALTLQHSNTLTPISIALNGTGENAPSSSNPRDLNNDGKTDLLFQNNAGQLYVWYLNGAGGTMSSGYFYDGLLAPWRIAGTADLNSDGNVDLLFQNANNGQLYVWYLNGAGVISSGGYFFDGNLGDFKVVGTSDLNNDGKADILFQNAAGQLYVWYMNGAGGISSGGFYGSAGLGPWKVVGTDDLNGDGNADLLFQNSTGQGELYVWYMNGAGVISSGGYFYAGNLGDFKVVSTGDLNGDGKADILFQNTAGQIYVWYMNGAGVITGGGFFSEHTLGDWRAFAK